MENLYINEDNVLQWDSMTDGTDDSTINDASITFDVKTLGGTSKATGSLAYVSASSGKYQGTLEKADAANLEAGTEYVIEITASSSGRDGFRRIPAVARYHQAS